MNQFPRIIRSIRLFVAICLVHSAAPQAAWALNASPSTCNAACQEQQLRANGDLRPGSVPPPISSNNPSSATPPPASSGAGAATTTPGIAAQTPSASGAATTSAGTGPACSETSGDRSTVSCDMTYRNTIVTCDPVNPMLDKTAGGQTMTWGTRESCPAKPMPMLDTPRKSFIKDYSPYLFAYARDPNNSTEAYVGNYFRGEGGADQVFSMFGNATGPNGKKFAPCKLQLTVGDVKTPEDQAKLIRLQLDNCSNQYILQSAMYPFQKDGSYKTSGENPKAPAERISVNTDCQPLKTVPDNNEYNAATYIKAAWKKLLQDPQYRLNKAAKGEPGLPQGVKIDHALPVPADFPDEIKLSTIGTVQTEEILDPSHPFSPRWDFERNERDHYSPKTAAYGGDPKNGVFCAGNKDKDIIKVDILSFREKNLEFDKKVMNRIDFNKNCKANSGLQRNPCCLPIPIPFLPPWDWPCRLMPCSKCYGMTTAQPACATDYANTKDRRGVRAPFLPVHPVLRVANGLQNMQAIAMSKLSPKALVGQVTNTLGAQLNVANLVASNLPIGQQLLPMLQGQSNLMGLATSAAKNMTMTQLSQITNISSSTIQNLGGAITNPGQMQSLLKGQASMLANTAGLGDMTRIAGSLGSTQALMGAIPGVRDVAGYMPFLSGQQNIVASINTKLPIAQALSGIRSFEHVLNNAAAGKSPVDIQGIIGGNLSLAKSLPTDLSIGGLQKSIGTQLEAFAAVPGSQKLTDALKGMRVDSNLAGISNLATSNPAMTVDDAKLLLNAQLVGTQSFAETDTVQSYAAQMATQGSTVMDLAKSTGAGAPELGAAVSSVTGSVAELSGKMDFAQVPDAITKPLNVVASLDKSLSLNDVGTMVSSLRGGLGSLNVTADLPIDKVSAAFGQQVDGMVNIGKTLDVQQFSGFITEQSKLVNGFAAQGLSSIGDARQLLNSQIGNIAQLPGVTTVQQLTGSLQGQFNDLKNLPALGQIGNFAADLDSKLLGSVGKVSDLTQGALQGITSQIPDVNKLLNFPGVTPLTKLTDLSATINSSVAQGLGKLTSGMSQTLGKMTGSINQFASGVTGKINGAITGALGNIPGMSALSGLSNKLSSITAAANPCAMGPNNLRLICVLGMYYDRKAACTPNEFGAPNKTPMASLCKDLRAPYTNLNKLKMRYHNPDDKDNIVLKEGVPEGYHFKDYFDDKDTKIPHMPYPKLWDTGSSIQKVAQTGQDPNDTYGQYTAIVGVGREAAPDSAAAPAATPSASGSSASSSGAKAKKPSDQYKDERCLFGGWGGNTNFAGVNIKAPDPVTSWSEIKLYQARALRQHGLSCLARYEKVFKTGSTENQLMFKTGGAWDRMIVANCPPDKLSSECTFESLKEYKARGGSGGTLKTDSTFMQTLPSGMANGWRGYISSKNDDTRFPNFGKKASLIKGLDKAELGDIILMPKGAGQDGGKPGLAKLALVAEANTPARGDCVAKKNCYVRVLEFDNGKSPDVCGTTDTWGIAKNRTLYRPGNLPQGAKDEYAKIKWTHSCEESNLSDCELAPWDSLELYRIRDDIRAACDKEKASDCK